MKKINFKSKKTKAITVLLVTISIVCIFAGVDISRNKSSSESIAVPTTKSSVTTTVHTTAPSTTSPAEPTTKDEESEKQDKQSTTVKSNSQKNSSSQNKSSSSGSSNSNSSSEKQTTKKNNTSSKKETTTKAQTYAMSASEIRSYALDQIAKIDGTIYCSDMTKSNSGWDTPLVVYPEDSENEINEGIRSYANGVYNGTTFNGYNVYVENSTDFYGNKVIKVYFLYGQRYTGRAEL